MLNNEGTGKEKREISFPTWSPPLRIPSYSEFRQLNSELEVLLRATDSLLLTLETGFNSEEFSGFEYLRLLSSLRFFVEDLKVTFKRREFDGDESTALRDLEIHLVQLASREVLATRE